MRRSVPTWSRASRRNCKLKLFAEAQNATERVLCLLAFESTLYSQMSFPIFKYKEQRTKKHRTSSPEPHFISLISCYFSIQLHISQEEKSKHQLFSTPSLNLPAYISQYRKYHSTPPSSNQTSCPPPLRFCPHTTLPAKPVPPWTSPSSTSPPLSTPPPCPSQIAPYQFPLSRLPNRYRDLSPTKVDVNALLCGGDQAVCQELTQE
jgi:hypothetical protein